MSLSVDDKLLKQEGYEPGLNSPMDHIRRDSFGLDHRTFGWVYSSTHGVSTLPVSSFTPLDALNVATTGYIVHYHCLDKVRQSEGKDQRHNVIGCVRWLCGYVGMCNGISFV